MLRALEQRDPALREWLRRGTISVSLSRSDGLAWITDASGYRRQHFAERYWSLVVTDQCVAFG